MVQLPRPLAESRVQVAVAAHHGQTLASEEGLQALGAVARARVAEVVLVFVDDRRLEMGTDAADEQFSEFNVASFLGHADSKVTAKHYIKRKLDAKRQIAEALASKLYIA